MGFSCFFILFFLCISFHQIPIHGTQDLIQKTCKNTKYYDLCVSSLKSDSTSEKSDTKGLAAIMVKLGISNATATNSYLLTSTNESDVVMKKVVKECAEKYRFASDSLENSVQDLGSELYDYAYMNAMAAADYPNACKNAFKRHPGLVYPPQIAVREEGLKHICDVVLSIIENLLATTNCLKS